MLGIKKYITLMMLALFLNFFGAFLIWWSSDVYKGNRPTFFVGGNSLILLHPVLSQVGLLILMSGFILQAISEVLRIKKSGSRKIERRRIESKVKKKKGEETAVEKANRVNQHLAYQVERYKQMTDPDVFEMSPFWQYCAVVDPVTRSAHAALHGKVFRANDPFWDHWYPPNSCG